MWGFAPQGRENKYSVGQIIRNRRAIAVSEFLPVDSEIFCEYVGFAVTKEKGKDIREQS